MNQIEENTVWKDITEFPNYEISNYGHVRNKKTGRMLKAFTKGRHYPTIALYNGIKTVQRFQHRLVALEFVSNDNPSCTIVHHLDENKNNSYAGNLIWTTQGENVADSIARHNGNTHIDRMKRTLGSPVCEYDLNGNFIAEYRTPQATGYHCMEFYKCLKNNIPFRGRLFIYKDTLGCL